VNSCRVGPSSDPPFLVGCRSLYGGIPVMPPESAGSQGSCPTKLFVVTMHKGEVSTCAQSAKTGLDPVVYSLLNESAGLAKAARVAWYAAVARANNSAAPPAMTKVVIEMSICEANIDKKSCMKK